MSLLERLDVFFCLSPSAWDSRRTFAPRFHLLGSPDSNGALFLFWRLFLAAYCLSVSVVNRAISVDSHYSAYLTVHSVWLVTAYFLSSALTAVLARCAPSLLATPAHALHARATQLIFSMAVPFQLVVVTLYWLLLASPQPNALRTWDNIESHGIKFALVWADLLCGSMVLATPQLLLTLSAAAIYLLINLAVTLTSYPVYSVLKWDSGASAVLIVGALVYMTVAFFLAQLLARLRDRLALAHNSQKGEGSAAQAEPQLYPLQFADDSLARRLCDCCCAAAPAPESAGSGTAQALLPNENP